MSVATMGRSAHALDAGLNAFVRGATVVSAAGAKVYELSLRFFNLGSSGFLVGFGVMELADFALLRVRLWRSKGAWRVLTPREIAEPAFKCLRKVENIFAQYSLIHGSFYLGSGICSGMAALHDLQWLSLGAALPFVQYLGSGLFLYLNLYALEQNLKLFYHAQKMAKSDDAELHSFANRLRVSAVLGMINNIGYILTVLTSFFPPTQVISLALGIFSIFVGSLKIIYDFFAVSPKFSQLKKTLDSPV